MTVEPIRDQTKINKMIQTLEKTNPRNSLLFRIGINTILRISDIIKLRYSQVFDTLGKSRGYLIIREQKTGKEKKIKLNTLIQKYLETHKKYYDLSGDDYLFFSFKNKSKHIDRTVAYKILKLAATKSGIQNFGTHSMRKTLAYYIYTETKNLALVMSMLNHKNPAVTLRYIGITQDMIDKAYEEYKLG